MNEASSPAEQFIYLRFVDSYGRDKGTGPQKRPLVIRMIEVLLFFIPRGNPEQGGQYWNVRSWKVEFDLTNNCTSREIGYDLSGRPIVCAPLRKDLGFWTDEDLPLKDYDHFNPTVITRVEFEEDWKKLNP